MHPTFEWTVHARDTDYSGLVYTPAIIDCMCRAMESFMSDIGLPLSSEVIDDDLVATVVHVEADYLDTIHMDDLILVTITPELGDTSVTFNVVGERDGGTMFSGHLVMVFVDGSQNPIPVPERIARKLEEYTAPE